MKLEQKTAGMLAEWIIEHRKGDAFKDDSLERLCSGLCEYANCGNMLYVLDSDVHIIGVATFLPDHTNKMLFVQNVLITKHTALVIFAQHFKQNFNGYSIVAYRNNEQVMYNTSRLINLLSIPDRKGDL